MAFLANAIINRLNLHAAIGAVAGGLGSVFLLAILIREGLAPAAALAVLAAILAGRFLLRPVIVPLAVRFGIKPILVAGTLMMAAQFVALGETGAGPVALAAFVVLAAVADVFYWPSYHAWFAALGDAHERGAQVAVREAALAIVGVLTPLVGAALLIGVGPGPTFLVVAAVQAAAILPLLGAPNPRVVRRAPGSFTAARAGLLLFTSDGWLFATFYMVWQLALFLAVKQSYAAFGGAVAAAALVGAVGALALGRRIDGGGGGRAALVAGAVVGGLTLLRAASLGSPWLATAANAPSALAAALWNTTMMSRVYNLAKASPCPLRFHVVAEAGYDAGCGAGLLACAALTAAGAPLSISVLSAVPAVGAAVAGLRRGYAVRRGAGGARRAT